MLAVGAGQAGGGLESIPEGPGCRPGVVGALGGRQP